MIARARALHGLSALRLQADSSTLWVTVDDEIADFKIGADNRAASSTATPPCLQARQAATRCSPPRH